jgi:nicotinic acid mononucleotide adenylyltransferase
MCQVPKYALIPNSIVLTPVEKLKNNLKVRKDQKSDISRLTVFVSTGSYCPIHLAHIDIFEKAKVLVFSIVKGYISPSHESYVKSKLGPEYIPSNHRLAMCQLAVKDSAWIDVSSWEIQQPFFVDFPTVIQNIENFLRSQFPLYTLDVFYLCGADHAVRCRLHRRNFKVLAVCRPGWSEQIKKKLLKTDNRVDSQAITSKASRGDVNEQRNGKSNIDFETQKTPKNFI